MQLFLNNLNKNSILFKIGKCILNKITKFIFFLCIFLNRKIIVENAFLTKLKIIFIC